MLKDCCDSSFTFDISLTDEVRTSAISLANSLDYMKRGFIHFNELVEK